MSSHTNKIEENKNQLLVNTVAQKQSGSEFTSHFVDNRPETVTQKKLQTMMNNSPQAMQLKAFQEMANNSPQSKKPAQLRAMTDNHSAQLQQPFKKKENKTGLPDNLKSSMENLSGISLDDVKVHRNSDKPARLQAHAYAQGTNIHLGPGQDKHLPHEAWHVVQQKQKRVKPTIQLKGNINVNDDARLEKEADVMGAKAVEAQKENQNGLHDTIKMNKSTAPQRKEGIVQRAQITRKHYEETRNADGEVTAGELTIKEKEKKVGKRIKKHQSALTNNNVIQIKKAVDNVRANINITITSIKGMITQIENVIQNNMSLDDFEKTITDQDYSLWYNIKCFGIASYDDGELIKQSSASSYANWLQQEVLPWLKIVLAVYRKTKAKLTGNLQLSEIENTPENQNTLGAIKNEWDNGIDKLQSESHGEPTSKKTMATLSVKRNDPTILPSTQGGQKDEYLLPFNRSIFASSDPALYINYQAIIKNNYQDLENTIVHEATHAVASTRDNAYGNNMSNFLHLTAAQGTANADSYAFFYSKHHS